MTGQVLIVDDEESIRHLLAKFLTQKGYTCDEADGVNSAQERLLANQYDVMLTDKNMPLVGAGNEEGLELIRWTRHHKPDIAIIVMTGYPTIDSALEALKLGAFDYLVKPLDLNAVQRKVERLCEYRKFMNPSAILNLYLDLNRQILEADNTTMPDLDAEMKKRQEILDHLFFTLQSTERTLLDHRQRLAEIAAYAEQSLDEIQGDNPAQAMLQRVANMASKRI
jgi:two-component system, NtrC family, response regulator HydG